MPSSSYNTVVVPPRQPSTILACVAHLTSPISAAAAAALVITTTSRHLVAAAAAANYLIGIDNVDQQQAGGHRMSAPATK